MKKKNSLLEILKYPFIDLWNDCKTIKAMLQGKAKMKIHPREIFKDLDVTFKENYVWFLLLILAFASGNFMAGKHYQNECNEYIWENYHDQVNFDFSDDNIKKINNTEKFDINDIVGENVNSSNEDYG